MALAGIFPATCRPTEYESSAIAYLCVDKQGARHFLEVGWHKRNQRYLYEATPAFAQRLQRVIRSVDGAHAQNQCWSGIVGTSGKESLGKMIDKARFVSHDLTKLTPSQCDEYYALRDATPISGRATNPDGAVATRPLPTTQDSMAVDNASNDDQTLPLAARKDTAQRASPRVPEYVSDREESSYSHFEFAIFLSDRRNASRAASADINALDQISVKHLVQWASSCDSDRLHVNDGYPRAANSCGVTERGSYLRSVLCGTDITVLVVNITESSSYIVDGACRLVSLVEFQQGKLPMVVPWSNLPDGVRCHPHGVSLDIVRADRYPLEPETLVEAFYNDLSAELQRSFLNAKVNIRTVHNLSDNNICPPSTDAPSRALAQPSTAHADSWTKAAWQIHVTQAAAEPEGGKSPRGGKAIEGKGKAEEGRDTYGDADSGGRKHYRDLRELTPSQRAECELDREPDREPDNALHEQTQIATPISGRATIQDGAVATRPLRTANRLGFMDLSDSEGMSTSGKTPFCAMSPGISQPSTAQAAAEPGPAEDESAGYGRQSLDDGTWQSDRQEACSSCSSQSIQGERVNFQTVSPAEVLKAGGAITDENKNPLLLRCAKSSRAAVVQVLLRAGADVAHTDCYRKGAIDYAMEITDAAKKTAMLTAMAKKSVICAVALGRADLVAAAVAKGCNVNETDYEGNTPLHLAVKQGSVDVLRILLMASAEVASKDKNGKGAVDHAKEIKDAAKRAAVLALMAEYSVICAVDSGKADLVAAAVAKGCNVNETDSAGNTCLHLAVKQGSDAMVRMLLEADCNLDAKDKNDKGAVDCAKEIEDEEKRESVFAVLAEYVDVICAVASGKADLVAAAVARGCNVNETDPEENSCLHLAAKQASAGPCSQAEFLVYTQAEEDAHAEIVAMVRILLEKGAAVSAKDKSGYTALDVARHDDVKQALLAHGAKHSLTYAVTQGNVEQVGDLIKEVADVKDRFQLVGDFIKEHADVNAPFLKALDEKKTAMLTAMAEYSVICAVALGRADLVAAAVAKGCYVNETDRNSWSGLDYAARLGHTDIVRVLLEEGADLFHSQRENGWSSLHHAAYERHADVVLMLVEAPDGERTHGKCKHVDAVLLKAAEPSNTKAAQNTKVAAPSSTSKADVVVIIDDDEPMTMTSSSIMTSPPKRAAKAAPAPKSPPPAGAQAAATSEDASDASRLRPAPSPAAGGAAATDAAKPPKPKVRQLPSWMTAAAKKQKAGDDAAAKASKMVGTEPRGGTELPAKRKAAGAADADSTEADPAPKKRAPRSRPTGPAAARKANGGTSRASRQLSPLKEATEVTDFLDDDEGMGLLEDLLADDEAPLISSRHMPTADTSSGRRKPESDGAEHVREEQGASKPHSGQKGKEECSDSARRSISIHSSLAVPDTPEAATPQTSARESEENGGNSSGQALGFRAAVAGKSDDDSDDEDPAARWRRRMDERNNKSASQQKSQASPSGSLPTGRNTVARAADSDDDVAIVARAYSVHPSSPSIEKPTFTLAQRKAQMMKDKIFM